jgi:hypothetical protein
MVKKTAFRLRHADPGDRASSRSTSARATSRPVRMTSGKDDIIMTSKSVHAARFSEKQARPWAGHRRRQGA